MRLFQLGLFLWTLRDEVTVPQPLLEVNNLRTYFDTEAGVARAVDGVSFAIQPGRTLAVVGESGCGKTVTALSILQLVNRPPARFVTGEIRFQGRDLLQLSSAELNKIRGGEIAMIFQEPGASLNPVFTIGNQIGEAVRLHRPDVSPAKLRGAVIDALQAVQVSDPERRYDQYPHELSGGMKQRVMIAMALACNPKLLIADEPTTAVDVTIQARILDLLRQIQTQRQMSILLITHDLGVVAELADNVIVMYAGEVIERGTVPEIFRNPRHPYTVGLFKSLPGLAGSHTRLEAIEGNVPPATHFPEGCRFRARCRWAYDACLKTPPLVSLYGDSRSGDSLAGARSPDDHAVACWASESVSLQGASSR